MILIFSADSRWGIGKDNRLLYRVKGDMAFFRETTTGGTVVMGRKTLESLPGEKPLPNRDNIVITRNPAYRKEGVTTVSSLEELGQALTGKDPSRVYCIGGAQAYRLLLPYSEKAIVTKFRTENEKEADAFMENLDQLPQWRLESQSEEREEDGIRYQFCTYVQEKAKTL